jgi:hypothetical protein
MSAIQLRELEAFPEPEFSALVEELFSDYEESPLLADVLAREAAVRPGPGLRADEGAFRLAAFDGSRLVGWTYARPQGRCIGHAPCHFGRRRAEFAS